MKDTDPTPFDLFDLSKPFGKGIARKATVAEARQAAGAATPASRTFGGLFFAMFGRQDFDDVRRWLDENGCWTLSTLVTADEFRHVVLPALADPAADANAERSAE